MPLHTIKDWLGHTNISQTSTYLAGTAQTQHDAMKVAGGDVMVDKARVVKTDIAASNGVIHVIDHVLLPPGE